MNSSGKLQTDVWSHKVAIATINKEIVVVAVVVVLMNSIYCVSQMHVVYGVCVWCDTTQEINFIFQQNSVLQL